MILLPFQCREINVIVTSTIADFQAFRNNQNGNVGFVPTMGALHKGHLSLIRKSKTENTSTVCSIFVNPLQFNNPEDFAKYPKLPEKDLSLLENEGCEAVFLPSVEEMYPFSPSTKFDFGNLESLMEGSFRPGHFNGVAIVVSKLFHIVQPRVAYFGRKDLQQTLVIRQLVRDLLFPLRIEVCETLREPDGLAMSSRNTRLSVDQRLKAPILYQELQKAENRLRQAKPSAWVVDEAIRAFQIEGLVPEYFQVVDADTLLPFEANKPKHIAICVAAYFGDVRLIDNLVFESEGEKN